MSTAQLLTVLEAWKTIFGDRVELGELVTGRDLWPVTAENGTQYILKRLSMWRNLPLADEARVLRHLASQGIGVAEFMLTDHARLVSGEGEDSFFLIPRLANDRFDAAELVPLEETIGRAMAELHLALASYPWSANSYTEQVVDNLQGALMLPPDLAEAFARRRESMIAVWENLPLQLVHGDMTTENVLLQRPGMVSGFIDFDHLPLAPRIWDITRYLSRRIRLDWRAGLEVGRLDHVGGFLRGYHRTSPLSPVEIEAIPAGIAAGNVLEVSYFEEISAGTLIRRKLPDHDRVLANTTEAARWHLANYEEVVAAVHASIP